MKRILLSLLLLITLTVQAQRSIVHTNKVTTGHWSNKLENWVWDPSKFTIINFIIQGNTIIADDVAGSTYNTYNLVVDSEEFTMWQALDEEDRECSFIIDNSPPQNISIMYDDVIYVYYIDYIE